MYIYPEQGTSQKIKEQYNTAVSQNNCKVVSSNKFLIKVYVVARSHSAGGKYL